MKTRRGGQITPLEAILADRNGRDCHPKLGRGRERFWLQWRRSSRYQRGGLIVRFSREGYRTRWFEVVFWFGDGNLDVLILVLRRRFQGVFLWKSQGWQWYRVEIGLKLCISHGMLQHDLCELYEYVLCMYVGRYVCLKEFTLPPWWVRWFLPLAEWCSPDDWRVTNLYCYSFWLTPPPKVVTQNPLLRHLV